ncbi:MAG: ribonuclease P protein component [Burkholderiales bacterium]|nr:ribonuclease P protein component [Burkholderiales bacterium]
MEHLKKWSQFQAVMSCGSVCKTPHFVLHSWIKAKAPEAAPFLEGRLLFGALTPKRWAKRAVTRNLIKRQIYEVSALYAHELTATAHVVRLHAEFDKKFFESASSPALQKAVRSELTQLFKLAHP